MRKIRLIFFLIIGMRCFCSSGQGNNPIQVLRDSTRITSLPFGVSLLTTYHFPGDIINFVHGNNSESPTKDYKTFKRCMDFYTALVQRKAMVTAPVIKKIKYLKIGEEKRLDYYEKRFKAKFKYKLPDMGGYEVYFTYAEIPMSAHYKIQETADSFDELYQDYGNLIFVNPKSKQAKAINIYHNYQYVEPTAGFFRVFFIGEDKTIQIFEGSEGEEDSSIKKIYTVHIDNNNGEVIISRVKR